MTTGAKVLQTSAYGMFKQLMGNRATDILRVKKLVKSISEVGQLQPIIVNENFEVIDGQARLAALEQLGLPVQYIIAKNYGHKECVAMNSSQTKWGAMAYIKSFADLGLNSYIYLQSLTREFNFALNVITSAATSKVNVRPGVIGIKSGNYELSTEQYEEARELLRYCEAFRPAINTLKGRHEYYYMALIAIKRDMPEVDSERLLNAAVSHPELLRECTSIDGAMGYLEAAYNYHRQNKLYLQGMYRRICDEHQKAARPKKGAK